MTKKVKVVEKEFTSLLVIGDIHIPFQDKRTVNLVMSFIKKIKPDVIILNGDVVDQYNLSRFSKDPSRKDNLKDELAEAREFFSNLRKICPNSRIVYVYGNHEQRFRKYLIDNAKEFVGLEGLTLKEQLHLDEMGIECIQNDSDSFVDTYFRYGKLLIGHFNKVSPHAGYTAKNLIDCYGISLIQSHTHAFGSTMRSFEDGVVGGWEIGCLCDLNPRWTKPKNWVHGFALVHHENDGEYFQVEPIPIINYQFRYGGKLWQG